MFRSGLREEDGFFDLDVKKGARPENIIFPRVEARQV